MVSLPFLEIHNTGQGKENLTQKQWQYQNFRQRFMKTREAVFKVAQYLNFEKNLTVTIPSMELAPNIAESIDYADRGDILCYRTVAGVISRIPYPVEVKQRRFDFTSEKDYPYPDMMVAQKINNDRAQPYAVFVVNKSMTHAFVVKIDTKDKWDVRYTTDKERGSSEDTYYCEFKLGEFVKL
jgi:hypothetical protein